jgi:hypothetical protein
MKNSRRTFLRNATGLVAAGLAGSTLQSMSMPAQNDPAKMILRTLGKTGIKVPIVSMGVMNSSNPNLL